MSRPLLTLFLFLLASVPVCSQCRYCNTYEDFLEDRWEPLDTVFCKEQSKGHTFMWGYSNITMKTGDKDLDKRINYSVFAVMQGKTLYVNSYNLRFEKSRFGKGFSKAARIGENDLLLVNKLAGKEAQNEQSGAAGAAIVGGVLFGIAGAAIAGGIVAGVTANKQLKGKVCYLLTSGADEKGRYDITLFEDKMMDKLLLSRDLIDLHNAYYAEKDKAKRRQASRILPILMEAGIIDAEE